MKIENIFEMQDTIVPYTGAITPTYVYLDSDLFDGATYYYEVIATNTDTVQHYIGFTELNLYVPANSTLPTRVRSASFTPNQNVKEKQALFSSTYTTYLYASRIIIVQNNFTKTELNIAIGTETTTKATGYANPPNINNGKRKFWLYDSSKFTTSGSITVEFEGICKSSNSTSTAYVCVKEKGTTTALTNGEISVLGIAFSRVRNTGGITLTTAKEYEIDFKSSASNRTATVYAARIIYRMAATVSKIEALCRVGWEISGVTNNPERRWLYTAGNFSSPTILYESSGYETAADVDNDMELRDHGTADSGTDGSSVTNSPLNYNSTTTIRVRSASSLTLTDGDRFYAKGLEADTFLSGAWVIFQVVSAVTGWRALKYYTEPPTGGAWNKLKCASEPPVTSAWNKVLYTDE